MEYFSEIFVMLYREKKREERWVVLRSKHICGFSDHIKGILPHDGVLFPTLARSLQYYIFMYGQVSMDVYNRAFIHFLLSLLSNHLCLIHHITNANSPQCLFNVLCL